MFKPDRILRNEEGASPGGAAPVAPPAPSDTGAAVTAPTPTIPADLLKSIVGEAVAGALPKLRDGVFAELRKAGALKKEPVDHPDPTPPTKQLPGAPTAATGLSLADVESMLERERVITARATKHELTDAQVRRMKAALHGVQPEQFATEADSFLSELGLVKATTTVTPTPVVPATTAQPLSDKGSPAPGGVLDWEREILENPAGASRAARDRHDAKHGPEKARAMRIEMAQRQLAGIKVTKPQG